MNHRIRNLTNFVLRFLFLFLAQVATTVSADESSQPNSSVQNKRYNVLFIAVDDLNDWVGCLGGNAQAITPNLDRFAKQQAMVMNKAYCPSTVCCPSRSSILTGKRPSTTGIYGNTQDLKNAPKAKDVVTLPEYFGKNGYHTLSTGKIFHKHPTASGITKVCSGRSHLHPF
jgi:arylsulfatase A-like enzyme